MSAGQLSPFEVALRTPEAQLTEAQKELIRKNRSNLTPEHRGKFAGVLAKGWDGPAPATEPTNTNAPEATPEVTTDEATPETTPEVTPETTPDVVPETTDPSQDAPEGTEGVETPETPETTLDGEAEAPGEDADASEESATAETGDESPEESGDDSQPQW